MWLFSLCIQHIQSIVQGWGLPGKVGNFMTSMWSVSGKIDHRILLIIEMIMSS